jgi:glycosyltransferase involved in cell wall biosynthesis
MVAPFAVYPKGTVSVRMLPIAKKLASKGHQVIVIIPPYDNLHHSGLEYQVDQVKISNVVFRDWGIATYILVPLNILRKMFSFRPDIVYFFKPKGYSGVAAIFVVLLRKLGFVRRLRLVLDTDDWEGYGGFNDYYLEHSIYPRIMLDFFDFQERWILNHADAVTVASRTLELRAISLGVLSSRIAYVPNGANHLVSGIFPEDIAVLKERLGIKGLQVILLYTRFFEYKLEKVVEILKRVRAQIESVKLLVVGLGELGEEKRLKELAMKEGVGDSILFAGWVERTDLPKFLAVSDVAIYPFEDKTLNRAKCPGKLVELMVAGKAIVADKVGQISEYIEADTSGILVDPEETETFASKVVELLSNETLRRKLGMNAQERITQVFEWSILIKPIEQALFKESKSTSKEGA